MARHVQWGHRRRLGLKLVAPDDELLYPPLSADEPFAVGRARGVALRTRGQRGPDRPRVPRPAGVAVGDGALTVSSGAAMLTYVLGAALQGVA